MKILAIMQNQWLRDAEKHLRHLDRVKDQYGIPGWCKLRRRMIHYALFAGCRSGRVLKRCLGEELCEQIIWDEASTVTGTKPSDCPPADGKHILWTLENVKPGVVLTLGKIATDAMFNLRGIEGGVTFKWLWAPHPACRAPADHVRLKEACAQLKELHKSGLPQKLP